MKFKTIIHLLLPLSLLSVFLPQASGQTRPVQGNILVAQNAGIAELAASDFSIVQRFEWPTVGDTVSDKTRFSVIVYDGSQAVYALTHDKVEGALKNARILPLNVITGEWGRAIKLPDLNQEYDRMVLVNDHLVAGGRSRNVQYDLRTKKTYRLPAGSISNGHQGKDENYVFIHNYENDRETPLRKISLKDGSIVNKFATKRISGCGFDKIGQGFRLTPSGIETVDLSQAEGKLVRFPKTKRVRGMNKASKDGFSILSDDSIDRLDGDRLIYSKRNDRRLFTISAGLDFATLESHEFEYNTGCVVVVK